MIHTINSILLLYCWVVAAVLVLFLFLVGRFYEIKFGQKSQYQLFLVPLGLFLVAAIWYTFFARGSLGTPLHDFVGLVGPDLLYLVGGLILTTLCYFLLRMMVGGRG